MSAVITGLVGAVVAFGLASLAERTQKKARTATPDGWKTLRASWLINGAIILSTALATFTGYFLLNGGSSLPNAATQNSYAATLLAVFSACTLYMAWRTYGRTVMWKGNELRVRSLTGSESLRRFSDISKVKKNEMRGEYRINFRDGSTLCFSLHMHGANELVAKLPRRAFRH